MQNLEEYMKKVNPEASYFFEAGGDRTFVFIVNIESVDMIPSIAEPLFQDIGAKVEFHPVMVFEDQKKQWDTWVKRSINKRCRNRSAKDSVEDKDEISSKVSSSIL